MLDFGSGYDLNGSYLSDPGYSSPGSKLSDPAAKVSHEGATQIPDGESPAIKPALLAGKQRTARSLVQLQGRGL